MSPRFPTSRRRLLAAAIAAPFALAAVPALAEAQTSSASSSSSGSSVTSENWAGYSVAAPAGSTRKFTHVVAAWTEPTPDCTAGQTRYAAFWVGIGGFSETSQALEQIGTEADCSASGDPVDYSWFELVPAAPVRMTLKIHAGDRITASVTVHGHRVILHMANETTGASRTKYLHMATTDVSSAEWVAEAPSVCDENDQCEVLPLAPFGSVTFSHAEATADGHTGTISDPDWTATAITLGQGRLFGGPRGVVAVETSAATPSALSSTGDSFTISPASTSSTTSSQEPTGGFGGGGGYPGGPPGFARRRG